MDLNYQLLQSVLSHNAQEVRRCLRHGANVHFQVEGQTLLHLAIKRHDVRVSQVLIEFGADVNALAPVTEILGFHHPITPLQLALCLNNLALTRMLIQEDVDPHIYMEDGFAAIHLAVIQGQVQNLRYILMKSNVNLPSKHPEYNGWTALHLAIHLNNIHMVYVLLDNEANIASKAQNGLIPLQLIKDSAMMNAILRHDRLGKCMNHIFHYLVEEGVNFNAQIYPAKKSLYLMAHEFECHEAIQLMNQMGAMQENTFEWNFDTLHLSMSGMSL